MADTRPTLLKPLQKVRLCLMALFTPARLEKVHRKDVEVRHGYIGASDRVNTAAVIFAAFWGSLLLVAASAGCGALAGLAWSFVMGCSSPMVGTAFQTSGGLTLVWGTLFVRGWEIQSHAGITIGERVNRWVYIGLYCVGTFVLMIPFGLRPCIR